MKDQKEIKKIQIEIELRLKIYNGQKLSNL